MTTLRRTLSLILFLCLLLPVFDSHANGGTKPLPPPRPAPKAQRPASRPKITTPARTQPTRPTTVNGIRSGLITRKFNSASHRKSEGTTGTKLNRPFPKKSLPSSRSTNGNSKASNRKQHVYGIFKTSATGKTSLYKFGISGGKTRTGDSIRAIKKTRVLAEGRTYSNRALQQVSRLNKESAKSGQKVSYSTRILRNINSQPTGKPTARQKALAAEKKAVSKHAQKRGASPRGNLLPKPHLVK